MKATLNYTKLLKNIANVIFENFTSTFIHTYHFNLLISEIYGNFFQALVTIIINNNMVSRSLLYRLFQFSPTTFLKTY